MGPPHANIFPGQRVYYGMVKPMRGAACLRLWIDRP